jgi:hypothetical protein
VDESPREAWCSSPPIGRARGRIGDGARNHDVTATTLRFARGFFDTAST